MRLPVAAGGDTPGQAATVGWRRRSGQRRGRRSGPAGKPLGHVRIGRRDGRRPAERRGRRRRKIDRRRRQRHRRRSQTASRRRRHDGRQRHRQAHRATKRCGGAVLEGGVTPGDRDGGSDDDPVPPGDIAQIAQLAMRIVQLRFELVDAILLQPQLAFQQLATGIVMPTTGDERRRENAEDDPTAEVHFGRSAPTRKKHRPSGAARCGMVAISPVCVNGRSAFATHRSSAAADCRARRQSTSCLPAR